MTTPRSADYTGNPVHTGFTTSRWSTANAKEAFPGVTAPLTHTFYFPATERATARLWKGLGLLERSSPSNPQDPDDRFFGFFYGRAAINVDRYGAMADRTPGTSAAAMEEQMFGTARPEVVGTGTRRRYPHIVLNAPSTVYRARRDTLRAAEVIPAWRRDWVERLSGPAVDAASARAAIRDALQVLEQVMFRHIMLTAVAQGTFDAVGELARRAGYPNAEVDLIASRQGTDETRMLLALRAVARGSTRMEDFLAEYGYHGPNEGHLDAVVWRQDPKPLYELLPHYSTVSEEEVAAGLRRTAADRQRKVDSVLRMLRPWQRPGFRGLLRAADAGPHLRELGKSHFLQAVDVARAASSSLGHDLAGSGRLEDPSDVYFLTLDELLCDRIRPDDIARRRCDHAVFSELDLPSEWTGEPTPLPRRKALAERAQQGAVISGLGVSAGTARGRARIVHDLTGADLEVGDVLVCHATDPSWVAVMGVASAFVIDVGGLMSHAAIVARELGVPCVIGTGDATRVLRDGDDLLVDGSRGIVEVVDPGAAS